MCVCVLSPKQNAPLVYKRSKLQKCTRVIKNVTGHSSSVRRENYIVKTLLRQELYRIFIIQEKQAGMLETILLQLHHPFKMALSTHPKV